VLVAADFSQASRQAFRIACSLARESETRIMVLAVDETNYIALEPGNLGQQSVCFASTPRDEGSSESLTARLRGAYVSDRALDVDYVWTEGSASDEILGHAQKLGCDLIVLGTHGRTGLERMLTGSVAEMVLRNACCPVLALRAPDHHSNEAPIRVVLHPTDFSDRSDAALGIARSLARDHGAKLVILHVAPCDLLPSAVADTAMDTLVYQLPLEEIRDHTEGRDLKYRPDIQLRRGHAATMILQAARELDVDLIVMGTHGRTGLRRLVMGSVAEGVLRCAPCPVLTVKTPFVEPIPRATHLSVATDVPSDPQQNKAGEPRGGLHDCPPASDPIA
jgi:nucleotide-binding universal stress UspA family protein